MTPRALLTAIGATALAFAVAIGIAAESTTDLAVERARVAATTQDIDGAAEARLATWNDSCAIAV